MEHPAEIEDSTSHADPPGRGPGDEAVMWRALFRDFGQSDRPLQQQIRQTVVAAIEAGRLQAGARMPSSRRLADVLDIARNTAVLAYAQLVEEGFLVARERSGYYVATAGRRTSPSRGGVTGGRFRLAGEAGAPPRGRAQHRQAPRLAALPLPLHLRTVRPDAVSHQ
jgi:GntR family transcriptional regulator/MocR family aminotransferase